MGDKSKIEWTEATWNPVTGCTKVSPGCDNCYAERITERFSGPGSFAEIHLHKDRLDQPLRWRRPRMVFVNSMSDLFHQDIPDKFIARIFAVMALSPHHTFQILTKRHARMRSLLNDDAFPHHHVKVAMWELASENKAANAARREIIQNNPTGWWPLPNVWLGVSVEYQKWADTRVPALLETPAAVRFLSCEPLLGWVDLSRWLGERVASEATAQVAVEYGTDSRQYRDRLARYLKDRARPALDWVIVGGESGAQARPMHPQWARVLRDQCVDAGIPFFFKQRGEWTWNEPGQFRIPTRPYTSRVAVMHAAGMTALTRDNEFDPFERGHPDWATRIERVGKKRAGRMLDGRTWNQMPGHTDEEEITDGQTAEPV